MMGLVGKADRSSAQLSIPPRGGNAGRNSHAATWANSPEPGCPGLRLRKRAFQSATVTQPVLRHARPVVASGRRTSCGLLGGVGDFPEPLGLRILARSS